MSSLSPGTVIDTSFTLLRPLGEGGMGVVWLARERPIGREVALKIVRSTLGASRADRLEREARALAALDHPGVLPVLRAGTDPATGLRYLATRPVLLSGEEVRRLCDDVLRCPYPHGFVPPSSPDDPAAAVRRPLSLADLLDNGKALPEAAALRIARDLSSALAAAHAAGILHRDVKPSNILFDASGRALLADFGLAKFLEGKAAAEGSVPRSLQTISLDESGSHKFLGSPAYAAPETFRGDLPPAPALDWYSFGAVLYEALTGERPGSAFRPPSAGNPDAVSRTWDALLRALLEPDPGRRLADAAAITRRLDAIGRSLDPAARRRRLLLRSVLCALGFAGGLLLVVRFHAKSDARAESDSRAESAEGVAPLPGGGSGEAEPPPVPSPAPPAIDSLRPAPTLPPRMEGIWSGDDRGPLQRLGTFRLRPVDDLFADAFASVEPEIRQRIEEGDRAWNEARPDLPAAASAAAPAWYAAAARIRDAFADAGANLDAVRLCHAAVVARLCWVHVVRGERGVSDLPLQGALAAIDPLVEADPARHAPVRSWLLCERACVESAEGRFPEAADDLKEAGLLWATYAPEDDAGCKAQLAAIAASLGGMIKALGDPGNALKPTAGAIDVLRELVGDPPEIPSGTGADARAASAAALGDLLAGCHYRLGDLHKTVGNRLEALRSHRAALAAWRAVHRAEALDDPVADAQVLGRIGEDSAVLDRYAEAVAAWEEMRGLLAPLLDSDRSRYAPVVSGILGNLAEAHRRLGDEAAARACEAEAAALESGSNVPE